MNGYTRWSEIRGEHVERAGGEDVVAAGRQELMAQAIHFEDGGIAAIA